MRRIDDNRKMRHFLEQGDDGNVEQVASRRIKRPDATFAQNDALITAEHHIFGGEQPLLHRCGETALEKHGHAQGADLPQQRKVLHVRAPICSMSA